MQIFKIRPEGFKEIRNRMLVRTIPIMVIAVIVGIVIGSINAEDKASDINVLPFVIPVVALAVGFGLYRGVNRQKEMFDSYKLTITNNLITREQLSTPVISIYLNNVEEIIKHKNGSFVIKGKDATDLISVPSQIDNYMQLESAL